jgi:hypothetical protein
MSFDLTTTGHHTTHASLDAKSHMTDTQSAWQLKQGWSVRQAGLVHAPKITNHETLQQYKLRDQVEST